MENRFPLSGCSEPEERKSEQIQREERFFRLHGK
jgi:hypothetical protein